MKLKNIHRFLIATGILLLVVPISRKTSVYDSIAGEDGELRCAIALTDYRSQSMSYPFGFNYELLREFENDNQVKMEIILADVEYNCIDSLLSGAIDLAVVPATDTLCQIKGFKSSPALDDGSSWVALDERKGLTDAVSDWLSHISLRSSYDNLKARFTPAYSPYRRAASGRSYPSLSPYDHLLKKYSAAIGWDWRMLAALVWKESSFRIEARSSKGAEGLMQMMPHTARRYEADDMLDPETNLAAATAYLGKLERMFSSRAANQMELMKFSLAAYNAGEGRILDMISLAESKGMPSSRWSDLLAVLPYMRDPGIVKNSAVKLGVFKGYETVRYVEEMENLYSAFCVIAPGQSSPGRRGLRTEPESAEEPLSADTQADQPQESEEHSVAPVHSSGSNSQDSASEDESSIVSRIFRTLSDYL
ncbi:MAG: transglycosylase SLT domain-containing protein [Bacteroidales bacterium]|nr:transglycosylase SLT domain-containing protein [Bacteroidales bacterium]